MQTRPPRTRRPPSSTLVREPLSRRLRRHRSVILGVLALVVLTALCIVVVAAVAEKTEREAATARAENGAFTPPALPEPTIDVAGSAVAVVGDATVSQAGSGVSPDERWTAVLEQRADVDITSSASSGGGYVAQGRGGRFAQLAEELPLGADIVVFFGGAADAEAEPEQIEQAVLDAIGTARERAPSSRLVMVGPVLRGGTQEIEFSRLRTTLQQVAARAGATWVDPYAAEWLPLSARSVEGPAALGVEDQRAIADRLESVLETVLDAS